jgi:hypothetical protein
MFGVTPKEAAPRWVFSMRNLGGTIGTAVARSSSPSVAHLQRSLHVSWPEALESLPEPEAYLSVNGHRCAYRARFRDVSSELQEVTMRQTSVRNIVATA